MLQRLNFTISVDHEFVLQGIRMQCGPRGGWGNIVRRLKSQVGCAVFQVSSY